MQRFTRVAPLRKFLDARPPGSAVGFVPTMGALHEGHIALVRRAVDENDLTVCSIFVNPTQFNQASDLEKYPRTPDKDLALLAGVGPDAVFIPPVEEIYPAGRPEPVEVDLGTLDRVLEGEFRPGHFAGVMMVVKRLLDVVRPDWLYLGQKDFQQVAVIRHMIRTLGLPVEVVRCPTVREPDGLALSSRNQRLTPEFRQKAPVIFRSLQNAARRLEEGFPAEDVEIFAQAELAAEGLQPEYFEVVEGRTLEPVPDLAASDFVVACAAAWAGEVRLIDNVVVKEELNREW